MPVRVKLATHQPGRVWRTVLCGPLFGPLCTLLRCERRSALLAGRLPPVPVSPRRPACCAAGLPAPRGRVNLPAARRRTLASRSGDKLANPTGYRRTVLPGEMEGVMYRSAYITNLATKGGGRGDGGGAVAPHPKTRRCKHMFLHPQKSKGGGAAQGSFAKSLFLLESLRFSPGRQFDNVENSHGVHTVSSLIALVCFRNGCRNSLVQDLSQFTW